MIKLQFCTTAQLEKKLRYWRAAAARARGVNRIEFQQLVKNLRKENDMLHKATLALGTQVTLLETELNLLRQQLATLRPGAPGTPVTGTPESPALGTPVSENLTDLRTGTPGAPATRTPTTP